MSALMVGIFFGLVWNILDSQRQKARELQLSSQKPEQTVMIDGVEYTRDDLDC